MDCLDAGYTGAEKCEEFKDRAIDWQVATKPGKLKAIPQESKIGQLLRRLESGEGEHPFPIVKHLFAYRKARHYGLKKYSPVAHPLCTRQSGHRQT